MSERSKKFPSRHDDHGDYENGPVSIINVQSKERKRGGNDRDNDDNNAYRDEQSISPLSFLEYHGDYRHEKAGKIDTKFAPINEGTNPENVQISSSDNIEESIDFSPFHNHNAQIATPAYHAEPRDAFILSQSIESSSPRPNVTDSVLMITIYMIVVAILVIAP